MTDQASTPEEYFAGHPQGLAVFRAVSAILERLGPFEVRVAKSQVAFRRTRGFAYLWLPGQYLRNPQAEVVLSFALGRRDGSARLKQVVEPAPGQWMHHLEVHDLDDIDGEVADWLREAADRAG